MAGSRQAWGAQTLQPQRKDTAKRTANSELLLLLIETSFLVCGYTYFRIYRSSAYIKVKVTGYISETIFTHSRVVRLRLKGSLVVVVVVDIIIIIIIIIIIFCTQHG